MWQLCGTTCVIPLSYSEILRLAIRYIGNVMHQSLVEANPKLAELDCDRSRLVERFNLTVGVASADEIAFQQAFVANKVTDAEAAAYIWFAEHMISATNNHP
jgi:hypothetical protein